MAADALTEAIETIATALNPKQPNGQGPTPAADWRGSRLQYQVLPSGNMIRLRQVGIFELIEQGRIPQTLSAEAAQVASSGMKTVTEAQLRKYIEVVNLVVCACAVEPKVSQRPEGKSAFNEESPEGTLYIDELTFVDRERVFKWACGLASRLRPFRPESAGTVPAA